ncbi:DegT/DnrJ/EryC1/StrS family aminotransferase [Capillimicrobium parvum]|uniref:UDP-4-amino-4-deoxy-L-arabinose--oxoglutarate aminotransferase n=1 Tax=Capillimicrobium parvum TaxID=2884022 RepID=A0A9E6Y225_9ACTN|nr:DegT/DnrJ/EryC1/StrS family aminotransferase [Capillimicrobium parvum]UGS38837.1 UDP-4-amino-4-deoxy-L-arabinose--oxoglutarate aminotransferase [Capillimicrobium parvum]
MSVTGTPFEIPLSDVRVAEDEIAAAADALRSGWLTMGPRTAAFEEAFAQRLGCRHAIAVANGTAALHLAYLAAGIGPGDEVIVPSYTFVATAAAVVACGAAPVFADVLGAHDPSLDPDDVATRITPRTRAVAVVHFAGYPAPVDRLRALCDEHGLALIEDAAHAPVATLHGRALGTWGLAGCFSLFSNKVLSVGEGGVVVTDDDDAAQRIRLLRSHAMTTGTFDRHLGRALSYDVVDVGFNYRLDEPRAALALARMAKVDADVARRRVLTRRYRDLLAGVDGIGVPYEDAAIDDSSCYVMPVMLDDADRRDALCVTLRERHGVQTSILYPPAHRFTAYVQRQGATSLPRTEDAAAREVTIPLYGHLTAEQQERVVGALADALKRPVTA